MTSVPHVTIPTPFLPKIEKSECLLNRLPTEILLRIINALSIQELICLELTSRSFQILSHSSDVWKIAYSRLPWGNLVPPTLNKDISYRSSYPTAYADSKQAVANQTSYNAMYDQWVSSEIGPENVEAVFISRDLLVIEKKEGSLGIYDLDTGELQLETPLISQELVDDINRLCHESGKTGQDMRKVSALIRDFCSKNDSHPLLDILLTFTLDPPDSSEIMVRCLRMMTNLQGLVHRLQGPRCSVSHIAASKELLAVNYTTDNNSPENIVVIWERAGKRLKEIDSVSGVVCCIGWIGSEFHIVSSKDRVNERHCFAPNVSPQCVRATLDEDMPADFVRWNDTTLLGWTAQSVMWIGASYNIQPINLENMIDDQETIITIYPDPYYRRFAIVSRRDEDEGWHLKIMEVTSNKGVTLKNRYTVDGIEFGQTDVSWQPFCWHFGQWWMCSEDGALSRYDPSTGSGEAPYPFFNNAEDIPEGWDLLPWREKFFVWKAGRKVRVLNFAVTDLEIVRSIHAKLMAVDAQQDSPLMVEIPALSPLMDLFQEIGKHFYGGDISFDDLELQKKVAVINYCLKKLESQTDSVEQERVKKQKQEH